MDTDTKTETRGRKALPPEARKAPQPTIKINNTILPLVKLLKSNLKNGSLTKEIINRLIEIVNNPKAYEQTNVLNDREQQNIIDSLNTKIIELETNSGQGQAESVEILLAENKRLIELNKDKKVIELNKRYREEHTQRIEWESKAKLLSSDKRSLTEKIERLEHLEHDCQCLTKIGERCTKRGKLKANYKGIELNVCLQHKKSLESNEKSNVST